MPQPCPPSPCSVQYDAPRGGGYNRERNSGGGGGGGRGRCAHRSAWRVGPAHACWVAAGARTPALDTSRSPDPHPRRDYGGGGGGGGERRYGGGRGGGQQRGSRGGLPGGDNRPQRALAPEVAALNTAIADAASWRELQRVLEGSSGGGAELDAYQLVTMLARAAALPRPGPDEPDSAADFQGFVAAVYGWLLSRADGARPQTVARALAAIGRLGLYNEELVGALAVRAQRELHNTMDTDLVEVLEAFASLGYAPSPEFAAQLLRRTQGRLPSMQSRVLSRLLGLLPRVGVAPTPEWMAACAAAALPQVRTFNASDFSALMVGLATAGWRPAGPGELQPLVDRCYPLLTYELRVQAGAPRPRAPLAGEAPPEGGAATAGSSDAAVTGDQQAVAEQRPQQQRSSWQRPPPKNVAPQVAVEWMVNVAWAFAQMVSGTGAVMPPQWSKAMFDKIQVRGAAGAEALGGTWAGLCEGPV